MSKTTLFLVRHGETDWNRSGQIMGQQAIALNSRGQQQALRLASWLNGHKIRALYSSPVTRAMQTAAVLASEGGLTIQQDTRLREIEVGDWAGRFWHELDHEPARLNWYTQPSTARFPGGETLAEVQTRAAASLAEALVGREGYSVMIVTHGDVLRALVAHCLRLPLTAMQQFQFDHASLTRLEATASGWTAAYINARPDPFLD